MKQGETVLHAQQKSYITPRSTMKQGETVPQAQWESCITARSTMKQGELYNTQVCHETGRDSSTCTVGELHNSQVRHETGRCNATCSISNCMRQVSLPPSTLPDQVYHWPTRCIFSLTTYQLLQVRKPTTLLGHVARIRGSHLQLKSTALSQVICKLLKHLIVSPR